MHHQPADHIPVPEDPIYVPVEDLTSVHIERLIFACQRQAEEAQAEYRSLLLAVATADHAYKLGYSKALISAEGSMELRKAVATVATEELLYTKQLAEARRDAQRELIMALRLRMDGLRTVSANLRVQS